MDNNNKKKNKMQDEKIEDTTRYGEFISSFNQWITPDRQKETAKHLEEVTEEISPNIKNHFEKNKKKSK